MRVTITTVQDFCAELSREAADGNVWRGQVRTRIDRAAEQDDEVSFVIGLWGTAIIKSTDGDYLMEYGEIVGTDDSQAEPEEARDAGTVAARAKVDMIKQVAENAKLLCLPGKFEAV